VATIKRTFTETRRRPWSSPDLVVYVFDDGWGEVRIAGPTGAGIIIDGGSETHAADVAWSGRGRTTSGWRWMPDEEGERTVA